MATIPMDVIHSCILPRLPVKSLTRFKSVSKSWQTIISSPEFIRLHHQHTLSSNANRLIVFKDGLSFHVHEIDSPLVPNLHWYYTEHTRILASSEFFLLIDLHREPGLILLNPSTGRYYKIPDPLSYRIAYNPNFNQSYYGMYLDDANNDYKVVRITQVGYFPDDVDMEVMVYSLGTNKWKLIERKLDDECYVIWYNGSAVIRHLLYILLVPRPNANAKDRIGCFDILAEKWTNDVPFPHSNDLVSICNFSVLDGLLCVTVEEKEENGSWNFIVWVMKECSVKDSWFKLTSIPFGENLYRDIDPIAFRRGSQDEVLCRRRRFSRLEFIWYNVREKKATSTTFDSVTSKASIDIEGYICKGSLVDFPGGRNIELHQPK